MLFQDLLAQEFILFVIISTKNLQPKKFTKKISYYE